MEPAIIKVKKNIIIIIIIIIILTKAIKWYELVLTMWPTN